MARAKAKKGTTTLSEMEAVAKEKGVNIEHGKDLNHTTYEYACIRCLENAMQDGSIYCIEQLPIAETGKCKCGRLTNTKAVLV